MLYQRVVETSTTESEQKRTTEPGLIMQDNMSAAPPSQKRQRNHEEEFDENPAHFRRVRLRYSDQSPEPESTQAAQETDISPNGNLKTSRNEAASTQADSFEQMTGVIASTSTDSASAFYADAELTVPDVAASTSASKSPAAKDEMSFDEMSFTYSSASEDDGHDRSSFFYSDSALGDDHAAVEFPVNAHSANRIPSLPHVVTFSELMIDPRATRRSQKRRA